MLNKKTDNPATALKKLNGCYSSCTQCPLATQGRNRIVFGEGNPHAKLMFIGEAPGKDEDTQGRPFVGRAGAVLTSLIHAMGLTKNDVYISNVTKCRPPKNRVPLPVEITTCTNLLLFKEIEIINPEIICTLGVTATQALLGKISMKTTRGTLQNYKNINVLPTYHPAYLLRNPAAKKVVLEDMQKIIAVLGKSAPPFLIVDNLWISCG